MKRLSWHFRQFAQALGLSGLFGLLMILLAATVYFGLVRNAQTKLIDAQRQFDLSASQPALHDYHHPDTALEYYQTFPQLKLLTQQLRALHQLADRHELSMGRVDYKLNKINGAHIVRYELRYSVVTDYRSLRHYIADVLKSMPNLALESIELHRFDEKAEIPQADLVLGLYFKDEP